MEPADTQTGLVSPSEASRAFFNRFPRALFSSSGSACTASPGASVTAMLGRRLLLVESAHVRDHRSEVARAQLGCGEPGECREALRQTQEAVDLASEEAEGFALAGTVVTALSNQTLEATHGEAHGRERVLELVGQVPGDTLPGGQGLGDFQAGALGGEVVPHAVELSHQELHLVGFAVPFGNTVVEVALRHSGPFLGRRAPAGGSTVAPAQWRRCPRPPPREPGPAPGPGAEGAPVSDGRAQPEPG